MNFTAFRWAAVAFIVLSLEAGSLLAADIRVATENGVTTVVFNGQNVFTGTTTGTVSSKSAAANGIELAAAYDDDRVIWENVPGAGQYLRQLQP